MRRLLLRFWWGAQRHLLHAFRLGSSSAGGLVADSKTPQKYVWRARMVLWSANGLGTHAIMREAAVFKTVVWRWQDRFALEGVEGLFRDKTRPAGIPLLGPEVAARGRSDAGKFARRGHALNGNRHEQGRGLQQLIGAADLARARSTLSAALCRTTGSYR